MRALSSIALVVALVAVPVGAMAQMGGGRMGGGMGWGNMSGMMNGFGADTERPSQLPPGARTGPALPFPGDDGTYQRPLGGRNGQTRTPHVSPWGPWGSTMPFTGPDMR